MNEVLEIAKKVLVLVDVTELCDQSEGRLCMVRR